MQENASVRRAGIIKDLLTEMNIEVMKWPPYSPDLHQPIRNDGTDLPPAHCSRHPQHLHQRENGTERPEGIWGLYSEAK